ncbi:class I SAM-dependent methyltransferase [Nocardia sp. NPDC023852]|uniref:class I SAM-dependent methyltransferase n=1 Tax=Nocardia sp. NPDC023852 TaxID=3154697 RepID=UPI0033D44E47
MIAELVTTARQAADAAMASEFDAQQCLSARDDMDLFGLRAMARVLRDALPEGAMLDADQIADRLRAAPRHRWLLRRWLTELTEHGWLDHAADGYRSLRERSTPIRGDLAQVCADLGFSPELARFFERANRQLPQLLADRVLAQELLFPNGDFLTAEAAYRDNPVNRYLNAAAREITAWAVRQLAGERNTVAILELGAGVGGTTADVVAALEGSPVDYHFTDLSNFFLTAARDRFAAYPWMRYGIVDLNTDLPQQPRYDIVLAANVLHNAHHSARTLRRLRDLLSPGGFLIFIESCREHCQLLTSMHFLMSARPGATLPGRTDIRAETDRIFLREHEWVDQLTTADLPPLLVLPDPHHPLAVHGQRVFAARRPATEP